VVVTALVMARYGQSRRQDEAGDGRSRRGAGRAREPRDDGGSDEVIYVAPVDANGDPAEALAITRMVHGHSFPDLTPFPALPATTLRTYAGPDVTDPGSVLCMTKPWSEPVAGAAH
jgi:hypothetical protein